MYTFVNILYSVNKELNWIELNWIVAIITQYDDTKNAAY